MAENPGSYVFHEICIYADGIDFLFFSVVHWISCGSLSVFAGRSTVTYNHVSESTYIRQLFITVSHFFQFISHPYSVFSIPTLVFGYPSEWLGFFWTFLYDELQALVKLKFSAVNSEWVALDEMRYNLFLFNLEWYIIILDPWVSCRVSPDRGFCTGSMRTLVFVGYFIIRD